MKKHYLLLLILISSKNLYAQNIKINDVKKLPEITVLDKEENKFDEAR